MTLIAAIDFDFLPWALCAFSVAIIAVRWPSIRGTTLVAPAAWTMLALLLMAIYNDALIPRNKVEPDYLRPLSYFAGITSLCPAMALFGAKRPQDRAWQFIVFTFWIVLSLPSLHWWLVGRGESFGIHSAQSWFLAVLLLMFAVNYLPTRFALSALLVALAQFLLLRQVLPFALPLPRLNDTSLYISFVALLLVAIGFPRKRTMKNSLDRLWLDFRNAFGAVWGLRVQQRVNQSAEMYGWKLQLDWHGFTPLEGDSIPPETEKLVRDNLKNLLRRFVSPEWIAQRLSST